MTDGGGRLAMMARRRANASYGNSESGANGFVLKLFIGAAACIWVSELEQDKRVASLNEASVAGCVRGVNEASGSKEAVTMCQSLLANTAQRAEDRDIIGVVEMNSVQFSTMKSAFEQRAYTVGKDMAVRHPHPSKHEVSEAKKRRLEDGEPIYSPA